VQGNTLVVAAPQRLEKPKTQVAPRQVKAKIAQPRVLKGWANVDPNEKAKLEQKFKSENPKNVPKPNIQPTREAASANATGTGVAPSPGARPGKGNRKAERVEAAPVTAPPVVASPRGSGQRERGNRNRVEGVRPQPTAPAERAVENRSADGEQEIGKRQQNKRAENATQRNAAAGENTRDQTKPKLGNQNPTQVRENDERANRNEEPSLQPGQTREAQQGQRDQMRNAPANAQEFGPGPAGAQHRERAAGNGQAPQDRDEQGTDQRKGNKNEREATPPPQ
jgi:hypothetical protein